MQVGGKKGLGQESLPPGCERWHHEDKEDKRGNEIVQAK